jgi:hypothetical protein
MATKTVKLTTNYVVVRREVDYGRGAATEGPTQILGVYPVRAAADRHAAKVGGTVVVVTNPV